MTERPMNFPFAEIHAVGSRVATCRLPSNDTRNPALPQREHMSFALRLSIEAMACWDEVLEWDEKLAAAPFPAHA